MAAEDGSGRSRPAWWGMALLLIGLLLIIALLPFVGWAGERFPARQTLLSHPVCFEEELDLLVPSPQDSGPVSVINREDCAVQGVTVVLNGWYRCNMGTVLPTANLPGEFYAPTTVRLPIMECMGSGGERFDPSGLDVILCEVAIERPRFRGDCGVVQGRPG